jgi:hypothetical protein
LAVLAGAVNVRSEFHSVAHGDHYVFRFADAVAYIGLSTERNACREHNQQAHNEGKLGDERVSKVSHHLSLYR